MLFNSAEFLLLFLPFALVGYYVIRNRLQEMAAVKFLVACSPRPKPLEQIRDRAQAVPDGAV